ncbi:restriction endonuclease subunit S [Aliivibrio salmonicida]|uniref:restriction endonuclease subunit S n=1 Tax=Aliivibrio salmonicida TaxID=40269 RepID=UPI00406C64A9
MSVERLITDNIDVWTSTVKTKSASGRGSSKKIELYGIKKLRELILELAVRGKLVPQDPTDEPASVLLERIAEEKAQLVKEKKIKKPKNLPEISDDEKVDKLPQGWIQARFGECFLISSGNSFKKDEELTEGEFIYCKVGDMNLAGNESSITTSSSFIVPTDKQLKSLILSGSIIFPKRGGAIATNKKRFVRIPIFSDSNVMAVKPFYGVTLEFSMLWLNSIDLAALNTGTSVPQINNKDIEPLVFHFPPKKEQHRIVAKVDELMSLCDQLEQQTEISIEGHQTLVEVLLNTLTSSADAQELTQNWQRISEHFDALFTTEKSIDSLKQTILQLAVMGKLVPQDSNDEPAAKLLERIAEEKAQLIKDKKIKKQKVLPEITEDEKPFNLPNGWEWERIGNLSHFIEYGSSQKTVESLPNGVPVLKMGDIQNAKLILGEHKVMSSDVDELPNLYVKNNDVLYNRTNSAELVGKTGIFKGVDDKYSFASYLIRIRCNQESIFPDYLNLSMNTPQFRISQIEPHIKKQCGQANVNGTLMKSMLVSLPPLKEQKRIFNKVNELIMMCDQLKTRLKESQTTQLHLTDAIIEKAL